LYDFHVHSVYSNDTHPFATFINICDAAIEKGLKGICFTDHIDIDYPGIEDIFDLKDYCSELNSLIKIYDKRIEIYKGIELGLQPHLKQENKSYSSNYDIDFVLGSVHVVGKKELYKGIFLEGRTEHEGILDYLDDLRLSINAFDDFDSLGHIDVVRRYLNNGENSFIYSIYKDYIADILECIINKNIGIEINTSGKRYGLRSFHPYPEILSLYKDLGGEIVTLGSDAHKPQDLGYAFDEALELLKSLNFKYYCIFKRRKPVFIKID